MLEQGETRLVPQPVIQQDRRINRGCEEGGRDCLGPVVVFSELADADLQMYLKACVAKFDERILKR